MSIHAAQMGDFEGALVHETGGYAKCPGYDEPCGRRMAKASKLCIRCSGKANAAKQEQSYNEKTQAAMLERHRRYKAAYEIGFSIRTLACLADLDMLPTWDELPGKALCSAVWRGWHG